MIKDILCLETLTLTAAVTLAACIAPAATSPIGTAHTRDTGIASTDGVTAPQPGWRAAGAEAVVWTGRPHVHAGDALVVLDTDPGPQLLVLIAGAHTASLTCRSPCRSTMHATRRSMHGKRTPFLHPPIWIG